MANSNLPLKDLAVLAWLPKGQIPAENNFDPTKLQSPPRVNPEGWWYLHQAITHAVELTSRIDKLPWIKVGDKILSSDEIQNIYHEINDLSWD